MSPAPVFWSLDDSGKVFRGSMHLAGLEQMPDQRLDVQPVEPFPPFFAQTVIQIVSVYIRNDSFHEQSLLHFYIHSSILKRQPTLTGGRRAGDAISGGVVHILADLRDFVKLDSYVPTVDMEAAAKYSDL